MQRKLCRSHYQHNWALNPIDDDNFAFAAGFHVNTFIETSAFLKEKQFPLLQLSVNEPLEHVNSETSLYCQSL